MEGKGTILIEDQEYKMSAGQIMTCPADSNRSIINSESERLSLLVIRTPNL